MAQRAEAPEQVAAGCHVETTSQRNFGSRQTLSRQLAKHSQPLPGHHSPRYPHSKHRLRGGSGHEVQGESHLFEQGFGFDRGSQRSQAVTARNI
jgi:hypothetical protein